MTIACTLKISYLIKSFFTLIILIKQQREIFSALYRVTVQPGTAVGYIPEGDTCYHLFVLTEDLEHLVVFRYLLLLNFSCILTFFAWTQSPALFFPWIN